MKYYRVSIILIFSLLFLLAGSNMLMAQETGGNDKTSDKAACCPGDADKAACCPDGQAGLRGTSDDAKDDDCCPQAVRIEDCTPEQRAECMKACDSNDPKCVRIEKKGK